MQRCVSFPNIVLAFTGNVNKLYDVSTGERWDQAHSAEYLRSCFGEGS